ncbi:hypothetical protein TPAU25S_00225 [Tsukamurella paurometabola]
MSENGSNVTTEQRNSRKVRIGYVVSDKMEKTIVVELEDRVKHALYGKIIRTTSKVKAHDEDGVAGVGDRVRIMETRPLQRQQALAPGGGAGEGQVRPVPPPHRLEAPGSSARKGPGVSSFSRR